MSKKHIGTEIVIEGGVFHHIKGQERPYPAWRYHKYIEPKIVRNTKADYQASIEGWKAPDIPITAIPHLVNWNLDLEDMNAAQLRLFALEEYGLDLPKEATVEKLIKAIWRLAKAAPDKGRMTLLAQSIEMNYDETIKEIEKSVKDMEFESYEVEM
jgi:hypothetical protein